MGPGEAHEATNTEEFCESWQGETSDRVESGFTTALAPPKQNSSMVTSAVFGRVPDRLTARPTDTTRDLCSNECLWRAHYSGYLIRMHQLAMVIRVIRVIRAIRAIRAIRVISELTNYD